MAPKKQGTLVASLGTICVSCPRMSLLARADGASQAAIVAAVFVVP
jgi:hypothetical protein